MDQHIEKLKSALFGDLEKIREIEQPLERLTKASDAVGKTIGALNTVIAGITFKNSREEIYFFKHTKPEILAVRTEEIFRYNLFINTPIGTIEVQLKFFEDQLKSLTSFFRINSFNYQYYKNNINDLDGVYFLKSSGPPEVPLDGVVENDSEFSTPMSYQFSKFIAYENLQYFLLERIALIKNPDYKAHQLSEQQDNDLKWTGDLINIVELAYGIWLTGQLNNGNASLNQIVRWLETNLHVTIGIIQRRFADIEKRKRLSPTKYIDQMRDTILHKIEADNL
jgi:hypothetical protein